MTTAWNLSGLFADPVPGLLLKSSLILLAGLVLTGSLSRATAGTRHLVWTATVAGLLLLPLFAFALPAWELPWLPEVFETVPVPDPLQATRPNSLRPATGTEVLPASAAQSGDPGSAVAAPILDGERWDTVLTTIYLAGVVLVLFGPLAGVIRLRRIRRDVEVLSDGRRCVYRVSNEPE